MSQRPGSFVSTAPPVDYVQLALIGRRHFNGPAPPAWYAAARELLASTPAAPGIDLATAIRNCCEAEADPDHPDTICINVNELTAIMQQCVNDASPESRPYVSAMGESADRYHSSFPYAHPLPVRWRWSEVWDLMCKARSDA